METQVVRRQRSYWTRTLAQLQNGSGTDGDLKSDGHRISTAACRSNVLALVAFPVVRERTYYVKLRRKRR